MLWLPLFQDVNLNINQLRAFFQWFLSRISGLHLLFTYSQSEGRIIETITEFY